MSRERKRTDQELEAQEAQTLLRNFLKTESASKYAYTPNSSMRIRGRRAPPLKTAICALLLFTGGTVFLILAIFDFMHRFRGWEKTWGYLSLGLIMFIPGSFSTYTLTGAYLGWRGFSYDQVPSYDD